MSLNLLSILSSILETLVWLFRAAVPQATAISAKQDAEPTTTTSAASQTPSKSKPPKPEPYTAARAEALFAEFADADDKGVIGPGGFENLCTQAELELEGAAPMILSWQFGATEMLKLHKDGWTKGTSKLHVSSLPALRSAVADLEKLVVHQQAPPSSKDGGLYDRTAINAYARAPDATFTEFYTFCFNLAKPTGSKNIEMETAVAFWSVLLAPRYTIMSELLEYIGENATLYKAANKDQWSMVLEFCRTVSPNLDNFDEEEAWPTLIDGFVEWKKEKSQITVDS